MSYKKLKTYLLLCKAFSVQPTYEGLNKVSKII